MLKDNERICDICGGGIAEGTQSRVAHISPEAAAVLRDAEGGDLTPIWEQNPDGTVRFDICRQCVVCMGGLNTQKNN